MIQHLERFHNTAKQYHLTVSAILLWQMLYVYMARSSGFVRYTLDTAVFTDRLQLTRQGFLQARKSLEAAGLLQTELDERQRIWYTLCLDGRAMEDGRTPQREQRDVPVSDAAKAAIAEPLAQQPVRQEKAPAMEVQHPATMQAVAEQSEAVEVIFTNAAYHRGDIIMNSSYKTYLNVVESRLGSDVRYALHSWLKQRQDNGWTLTLWGLEALLQNLIRLAEGQVARMVDIVKQSIRRRWRGFFALRVQSRPSGAKLVKEEQRAAQTYRNTGDYAKPAYTTDDIDLSIFEE